MEISTRDGDRTVFHAEQADVGGAVGVCDDDVLHCKRDDDGGGGGGGGGGGSSLVFFVAISIIVWFTK